MILKHFPPPFSPRPAQARVLEEAYAAFEDGHRFVLMQAPPGVGKSHAAVTLARALGSTYVCTLTKQLQTQYMELFEEHGMKELKGKSSFFCARALATCDVGSRRFKYPVDCPRYATDDLDACPYKVAKAAALASSLTVCNYSSYLFNITPLQGGRRPLLVLDEGHECERVLMDFVSITVDGTTLPIHVPEPLPDPKDTHACFEWLVDFLTAASGVDRDRLSEKALDELEKLERKAVYALELRDEEKWISESMETRTGFALKPLTVRSFGERLFRYGERVLIMSATILDPEALATSLGIEDYEYIEAPCPFPAENRPIVAGGLDMTKKNRDAAWPVMVEQVESILEGHAHQKGLILTPSIEMLKYIVARLSPKHQGRVLLAYGANRMKEYQRHLDSKEPTVLGGPGLWEGADLKEDLSRFQIIPAIPRPFWGGQIAARARIDPNWYRWRSYTQFIQGVGRSVRSETDSATTYCLDIELRREAERSDSILPAWFKEAMEFT